MTNQVPDAPTMPPETPSIFQIWINALTKPSEKTYAEIAASPKAKAMTAYLWVFAASIVTSLVTLLVQGETLRTQLARSGLGTERLGTGLGAVAVSLLCATPIVAIVGTVVFAVIVALVQWIAKMFGGKGTNDQLAYAYAAISVPYSLVSAVFILLSAIPYVGFCFRILLALAGIYIFVLQVMAVKGVNQFGWGPAFGSVLIPVFAVVLICCCVVFIATSVMGLAIGNVFSSINQSLAP